MKRKLIIFGSSGIGQIAKYYFDIDSDFEPVCFALDREYIKEPTFEGLPVVAMDELISKYPPSDHAIFIAIGYSKMNKIRAEKYNEAKAMGYPIASYISSRCTYLSQFKAGENSFIFEDNTIQPFVKIGNNVTLWSGNHIGHHTVIEDHNFISSHVVVSGHCHIESYCFIGVNVTIGNEVRIAAETLLGAGSIITKSTEFQSVYVPAKSTRIEKKSSYFKL